MRVKTYYTPTLDAALQAARKELGEDALLLNSRPPSPGSRNPGSYEVTFGVAGEASAAGPPPMEEAAVSGQIVANLMRDVGRLCEEVERAKRAVARSGGFSVAAANLIRDPDLAAPYWALVESDFLPDDALELVAEAARLADQAASSESAEPSLSAALRQAIAARLRIAPAPAEAAPRAGARTIAVVGPPGAGKTTALVKMAVVQALTNRRQMQFLSHDTLRVGASEQLRTYAMIVGAGFQDCETLHDLEAALSSHQRASSIWIDTPGIAPGDSEAGSDFAAFVAAHPEIDVHLVLSVATRTTDLLHAVERYRAFRPDKVLLTHLDETGSYGALYTVPRMLQRPVSYFSQGQRIPEDLELATEDGMLSRLLSKAGPQSSLSGACWEPILRRSARAADRAAAGV